MKNDSHKKHSKKYNLLSTFFVIVAILCIYYFISNTHSDNKKIIISNSDVQVAYTVKYKLVLAVS